MVELIKPRKLSRGDTIGIVAPSMHIDDSDAVENGIAKLKELGFNLEIGPNLYKKFENTTAPAQERAQEIMDMFVNPKIKAIVCLYGGGRSSDVLGLLDYDLIARNPKIFSGMSDITHFNLALLAKAKMISMHGLDLRWGFGTVRNKQTAKYNIDLFMSCCTTTEPLGIIPMHSQWECWRPGQAKGRLVGGYIGIVAKLSMGEYWPTLDNGVLFWETPNCDISRIEGDLSVLESNGIFEKISGLLIGHIGMSSADSENANPNVKQLVLEVTEKYGFPILGRLDFGHQEPMMPLPEGLLVRMDAEKRELEYLESMVVE